MPAYHRQERDTPRYKPLFDVLERHGARYLGSVQIGRAGVNGTLSIYLAPAAGFIHVVDYTRLRGEQAAGIEVYVPAGGQTNELGQIYAGLDAALTIDRDLEQPTIQTEGG